MISRSPIISEVFRIVEDPRVKAQWGGNFEHRFSELARCLILQGSKGELAIFLPEWLGTYRAIDFDIERNPAFAWQVMNYLFRIVKAKKLTIYTYAQTSGAEFGGACQGCNLVGDDRAWWTVEAADFATAREARDAKRTAAD